MSRSSLSRPAARRARPSRPARRGVALVMVIAALTVLTVMLAEFQDDASASLGSALVERDRLKAEYAARSAVNLSRLLIAAEPTIRKAIAPLFLLTRRAPPQIPVWEFADQVLGAFGDQDGAQSFAALAGVDVSEGKNLGFEGAGFRVSIVDEDSKINVNAAARGDSISKARLAAQLLGLMTGPQYDAMFENRDADGNFSDRAAICSAIIDWADFDQEAFPCDPHSGVASAALAEEPYYELLKPPYARKNAAFDSLEELRLVRGVGDDFWAAFVEPDPDDPRTRTLTVWGQGAINVNTANAQTIYAVVCGSAVEATPLCADPVEAAKFLSALGIVRTFTAGAPLFSSPRGFVNALKGKGMFGTVLAALELQPVVLRSDSEMEKAITTESKVFGIHATGYVRAGTRETRTTVHAVVDFRGAPPPGALPAALLDALSELGPPAGRASPTPAATAALPEGATPDAIAAAFQPSPAGHVVHYAIR